MGASPYEIVIDVLTGLTNCLVWDFMKLFDFILQQAKVNALSTNTHERNMLEHVKEKLSKAIDATIAFAQQASGMLATN